MLFRLKTILNIELPALDSRAKLLTAFVFATFVYLFLLIFQPFGIPKITSNKAFVLLGYPLITFLVLWTGFIVFHAIIRRFYGGWDVWKIKQILIFDYTVVIFIGLLNWLYSILTFEKGMISYAFWEFVLITLSVGIIPLVIFLLVRMLMLGKAPRELVSQAEFQEKTFQIGNHGDKLEVHMDSFICIKAEGNYIKVYTLENDHLRTHMVRYSLAKVGKELEVYKHIKRCHRSFLINTSYLDKITGNSRNYGIRLHHLDFVIPVSRNIQIEELQSS